MTTQPDDLTGPVFDPQRLVRVTDDDPGLIQMLLVNFTEDIQRQFQAFRSRHGKSSIEEQYAALHKMKGSLGNIGAVRLLQQLVGYCERVKLDGIPMSEGEVENLGAELDSLLKQISTTTWKRD
jgi:HPt (histidine-containing phosphotransfer) domain-containing protein